MVQYVMLSVGWEYNMQSCGEDLHPTMYLWISKLSSTLFPFRQQYAAVVVDWNALSRTVTCV